METDVHQERVSEVGFASVLNLNSNATPPKWGILFATFFSHLVLPNLTFSHGVILLIRSDNDVPIWNAILAPFIFCITWTLTDPIFREAAESWSTKFSSRNVCIFGVFLAFFGLAVSSFVMTSISYNFFYGILGSLGTSIVLNQINFVVSDVFYTNISVIHVINNLGEAIGQFILPFIEMILFHYYGTKMGHLIFSCVVLQILPIIIFIKTDLLPKPLPLSRYNSYSRSYNAVHNNESSYNGVQDFQLDDMSTKTWRNPSDENVTIHHMVDNKNKDTYQSIEEEQDVENQEDRGFQILPKILEESEDEIFNDNNDHKTIDESIKRYSMISDKFDEFIVKTEESENKSLNTPNTNEDTLNTEQTEIPSSISKSNKWFSKTMFNRPSYKWHNNKRVMKNKLNHIHDLLDTVLIKPLIMSFKMWRFYPSLLLQLCVTFVPMSISLILPLLEKGNGIDFFVFHNTILVSMHALAWLGVLIVSPRLINISKSKYRYITYAALLLSSIGLFILVEVSNIIWLAFATLLIGSSNGVIFVTAEETLKEYIGVRYWSKTRNSLKVITAPLIIALTIWTQYILQNHNVKAFCGLLSGLQSVSVIIFSILTFIKITNKNRNLTQISTSA